MKLLVFISFALLGVQAIQVPYIIGGSGSSESSEEEYRIILPNQGQRPISLPGIGIIQQPSVQAVKIKVPRYASPEVKQLLLTQGLAARGINLRDFAPRDAGNAAQQSGLLVRGQREVDASNKVESTGTTVTAQPVASTTTGVRAVKA